MHIIQTSTATHKYMLVLLSILTSISFPSTSWASDITVSKDLNQSFYQVSGSRFSSFFVDNPSQLREFKQIQLLPVSFDRLTVIKTGKRKIDKSWDFELNYQDLVQEAFNKSADKVFDAQALLTLSDSSGHNLALQLVLESFEPDTFFYEGIRLAESDRLKRIGVMKFRFVLTNFQNGQILAIASAMSTIARNGDTTANSSYEHKMAWADTLANWQKELLIVFAEFQKNAGS